MWGDRKLFIVILALLVLGGGIVFVWSREKQSVVEEPPSEVRGVQEEAVTADLVLDFGPEPEQVRFGAGEEKIATYSGVKVAEKTILGLLLQVAAENDFEVDYNPPEGGMGAFVKSIGGVENTNEKFWQFWVNGEYGQVAMDQQEIEDGDVIEIKFRGFE